MDSECGGPSGPLPVTGSMLYDFVTCPHRVAMDLGRPSSDRDPVSPFVQMLWRCGSAHEDAVVGALGAEVLDLREAAAGDRERLTRDAMARSAPLIVGGEISRGDMLGRPDLLRLGPAGYVAGDVKSGTAEEAGRAKVDYGVQLAHYAAILAADGHGPADEAVVIDARGDEVRYDLAAPNGRTTILAIHADALASVRGIRDGTVATRPALGAPCKLCHWRGACRAELERLQDLTLVPQLGRRLRDALLPHVSTLAELAGADHLVSGRPPGARVVTGLSARRMAVFRDRARLLLDPAAAPYARAPLGLRRADREIFFDIEADPGRDHVYLHGAVERLRTESGEVLRFHAFFAEDETEAAERDAFARAMAFLLSATDAPIYYWSKYERTAYRRLCAKHPGVCEPCDVEALFHPERAVDLYFDVVAPSTEWPTNDHSIKSIAKFCGFRWRDADPSGAASIEWFDRWVRTRAPELRQRIVDYNEDDCLATAAVLDALIGLEVRAAE